MHPVGFITKNFVTMQHGHVYVKNSVKAYHHLLFVNVYTRTLRTPSDITKIY
jgi:hypothetical protein